MFLKFRTKKLSLLIASSVILFYLIYVFVVEYQYRIIDLDRNLRLEKINELIHSEGNNLSCKHPILPVNSSEILKFVHDVPPIDCSSAARNWVECKGSRCLILQWAKSKYGYVKCSFTDIIRDDDYRNSDGGTTYTDSYYQLVKSDVVRVSCTSSSAKWSSVLTGIRIDKKIWDRTGWDKNPKNFLNMNVLMFGFDSMSRNAFIRKLPKSYHYLTKHLGTLVLEGYNIVGDGTPQALIPILTGKTELELPETRKRVPNAKFVNAYPFIWNDFRDAGYVTGFFEDVPSVGTFTYRLKGFNEVPTDHYMRPYYLASHGEKWPNYCAGSVPMHKIMFNQITDFFDVYSNRPKFLFAFHGELSHNDYNLIGAADDDMVEFLFNLKVSGALDNTILIIMADHGHRFANVRNTLQGKQEERLPFFSFTFPQWFKDKHPDLYQNFKYNLDKLATPFDIHSTLLSVLRNPEPNDLSKRSLSLFAKVPPERSCADAFIEPHWCACLVWETIDPTVDISMDLANYFISTLNNYTASYRKLCQMWTLLKINWVSKLSPSAGLLKFKKNADMDGFVGDFSGKTSLSGNVYQLNIELSPGGALFEASISHDFRRNKFSMKLSDVSRINVYGRQARCIEKNLPHLRKYCYCKTR